jgi:hypothetical protein
LIFFFNSNYPSLASAASLGESSDLSVSLDSELCLREGHIVGTRGATGHKLLVEARIDLSASALNERENREMQKKLELLNEILEQEVSWKRHVISATPKYRKRAPKCNLLYPIKI